MDEAGPFDSPARPAGATIVDFRRPAVEREVSFDRRELTAILNVYGRMVAASAWRDYAIDHLADRAVFSVFRRSGEVALHRIEKNPKLAARQGAYSVSDAHGRVLKRGHDLPRVLAVLEKKPRSIDP